MKKYFLFLAVLASTLAFAAPPDYVVYFVKGEALKSGSKPARLKKGDQLFSTDKVILRGNAQVVLICKNFTTVQLQKQGAISLNTLQGCDAAPASLTSTYFHYVWEELTSHHGAPENNPKHYMRNKGAVSRGCTMVQTAIDVDTIYYHTGSLPVFWKSAYRSPDIRFYNAEYDGRLLYKDSLGKNPVLLNEAVKSLKTPGIFYWEIAGANAESCSRNYLQVLDAADYRQRVDSLLRTILITTPAETAYMKAYILEENHFLAEAFQYYQQAFQLAPRNLIYQKSQNRFYEFK